MRLTKVNCVEEYILKDDRALPVEEQTIFVLKSLDAIERAAVMDEAASRGAGNVETSLLLTQHAIVDIKNLFDADGKKVKFKKEEGCDYASIDLIKQLGTAIAGELSYHLAVSGGLIAAEKE